MTNKPTWRKSSYSANHAQCVEVAAAPGQALVRDSKDPDAGHLSFGPAVVAALVDACTAGDLDHLS